MLDAYCSSLSDEAQLKIAIRLGKIAVPIWNNYFEANPDALTKVNALVGEEHRLAGGAKEIDAGFVGRALEKLERSYAEAKGVSPAKPVPVMKSDATLSPMLATCMQPLTNRSWDATLPESVRLVFTCVFNILTWILYRRNTPYKETHIYVGINQACDAIMREKIMSNTQINAILQEYKDERFGETEDEDWENAFSVGRGAPMEKDDIFRKFIGEPVYKNQCGRKLAKEVLRQMLDDGKKFSDDMDEYLSGYSKTYSYNREKQTFWRSEFDTIVGGGADFEMTEKQMLDFIAQVDLTTLRENGFEV